MALVTLREILDDANRRGYACGAFNINNMEMAKAIVETAVEESSPVIIQVSEGGIEYAGIEVVVSMVKALADKAKVPIALHLDHGKSFENILKCMRYGFTSVMIDGSHLPLEENIKLTSKVVELAHPMGMSVEAELGKIAGIEDNVSVAERDAILTDPDDAAVFVERTGVDALAVAIGTAHGPRKFKGEPKLAIDLVKKIKEKVGGHPLVMHGASGVSKETTEKALKYGAAWEGVSGVPDSAVVEAIKSGINKVNIDTDMRLAFTAAIREVLWNDPGVTDPRKILGPAKNAMKEVVRAKMRLFGSAAKA